ncbi:hypothetical protein BS47DRAFT_1393869 [Hydnum rufescens UP504]|uniref:Uncharacterized protein n=1 Tax=Hydnum rufescens UP504 TaxID=1448309 RepID=A0A9P6DVM6_9AGAM|nr:hypothetical protein BS47DRAFT_1393869 [Hydnum rufescens UP504]
MLEISSQGPGYVLRNSIVYTWYLPVEPKHSFNHSALPLFISLKTLEGHGLGLFSVLVFAGALDEDRPLTSDSTAAALPASPYPYSHAVDLPHERHGGRRHSPYLVPDAASGEGGVLSISSSFPSGENDKSPVLIVAAFQYLAESFAY